MAAVVITATNEPGYVPGATFRIDGHIFRLTILDERPEVDHDPTLLLFRDDEDEAVLTVHLSPESICVDGHLVIPEVPE